MRSSYVVARGNAYEATPERKREREREREREKGTPARRTRELLRTVVGPRRIIRFTWPPILRRLYYIALRGESWLPAWLPPCDPRPPPRRLASNPISPARDETRRRGEISAAKLLPRRGKRLGPPPPLPLPHLPSRRNCARRLQLSEAVIEFRKASITRWRTRVWVFAYPSCV